MKGKTGGIILAGLGVLFVAAALILKFVVVPAIAVFPDDVDTTRHYEGTLVTMMNADALATGDLGSLFLENIPVTIDRHVTTESTSGQKALVREQASILAPDGSTIIGSDDYYTIDRKSMDHIANFTDNANVQEQRQGLVIGFPTGTKAETYEGWSDDYQALQTLEFVAKEDRHGLSLYHFRATSDPQPILDEATLAMFPPGMPKGTVLQLAPMIAPPEVVAGLAQFADALPDPVPFGYTYGYETNYWVDPTTGVLVDYSKTEQRYLTVMGQQVTKVFDLNYVATADSIADAKKDAEDNGMLLNLFGTIIPWSAIGLGVLLILGGGFMLMRKKES